MKIKIAVMFTFLFAAQIHAEEEKTERYEPRPVETPKSPSISLRKTVLPTLKHTESQRTMAAKEYGHKKEEQSKSGTKTYTSAGIAMEQEAPAAKKNEAEIKAAPAEHHKSKIKIRTEDPAEN